MPGQFRPFYERFPHLWDLLTSDQMIARMKALSRRGVPAVAAMESDAKPIWEILETARRESPRVFNQTKRMLGHMVRQVMESPQVGYQYVGTVSFDSWIFSSGGRYRDPDWRRWIYVHCSQDAHGGYVFCLARTKHLSNLTEQPISRSSSWTYHRRCACQHELEFILDGSLTDWNLIWEEVCGEIQETGYVLMDD